MVQCGGMEGWNSDELEKYLRGKLRSTYTSMKGDVLRSCSLPVVMAAGSCGTLWHESCGHSLEAAAIAEGNGDFIGLIGETVASSKVTLIDDGTMPGLYGSSMIDDEGHPRQRNVMIENGVLRTYLCDHLQGKKIGMKSNGCGRRQDYTFAPTSRMSNTYLAPGSDDEDEMIRSLAEGLYVKRLGVVHGLTMNGSMDDLLMNVEAVGDRLSYMPLLMHYTYQVASPAVLVKNINFAVN
ncbi:MAG: TldD/PmbA family protein [Firmicutes bacterium]|nr:TldD/PmbA family protein [Bacillota bacterium]